VKPNGAVRWIKTARANHYLDAEALASAAGHLLNVHLLRDAPPAQPEQVKPADSDPRLRRRRQFGSVGKGWITDF
jgi:hypothetical protein